MKYRGALFLIMGVALLICSMVCIFLSVNPIYIGLGIILSVILNAIGVTSLTSKK